MLDKRKLLLLEKQDILQKEVVKVNNINEIFSGFKVHRIVKPRFSKKGNLKGYKIIARYNPRKDECNLSGLKDLLDHTLVSLDIKICNEIRTLIWNKYQLLPGDEDCTIFGLKHNVQATEEDVKIINEVFPEYYEEALKLNNITIIE